MRTHTHLNGCATGRMPEMSVGVGKGAVRMREACGTLVGGGREQPILIKTRFTVFPQTELTPGQREDVDRAPY